jgi:hypothetical protein
MMLYKGLTALAGTLSDASIRAPRGRQFDYKLIAACE